MANDLVVRRTQLPKSQSTLHAAQYVRMSTDYQRYSIENQAAVIATYAQLHHLLIVRTYRDEGPRHGAAPFLSTSRLRASTQ
jgi:hypothetical protein